MITVDDLICGRCNAQLMPEDTLEEKLEQVRKLNQYFKKAEKEYGNGSPALLCNNCNALLTLQSHVNNC